MKESTAPALWAKLRATQPRLLRNTPTRDRCITWDEIDGAELPLFGDTRRKELPPSPRFEVVVGGEDEAAGEAEGEEVRRLRAMVLKFHWRNSVECVAEVGEPGHS